MKIGNWKLKIDPPLPIILLLLAASLPLKYAMAQEVNSGIASTYTVEDKDVVDGDVLCFSEKGDQLVRCTRAYDEKIFGIFTEKPEIVLRRKADDKPVVREGRVFLNVTSVNGPIVTGDSLTSSSVAGKAQKATEPIGFILGRALGPFNENDGTKITVDGKAVSLGRIEAALFIGPQGVMPRGTVFDKLGYILVKGTQTPQAAGTFLRYIMAGILTVSVSAFALSNFGRTISKGVEAIGRNPLARNQIQIAILINTVVVIALVIGSIFLGLVIIRI